MAVRPLDPTGPKLGVLLPDFTVETTIGRTIHRREFKGRKHLVVCFAQVQAGNTQELLTAIAVVYPSWQAQRAESLLIVADPVEIAFASDGSPIVVDVDGRLRALHPVRGLHGRQQRGPGQGDDQDHNGHGHHQLDEGHPLLPSKPAHVATVHALCAVTWP